MYACPRHSAEELAKKVSKNRNSKKRWVETEVLVVDEISMLDADLFDKLDAVGRACRPKVRPESQPLWGRFVTDAAAPARFVL